MSTGDLVKRLRARTTEGPFGMLFEDPDCNLAADAIEAYEEALRRILLDIDFMVESGVISDIRNDVIYMNARAALEKHDER